MTQYGRPESDVSTGGWATAPLYAKIDEETANDADEISAETRFSNQTFEVGLAAVDDPGASGDHVVRVRGKFWTSGSRTATLDVVLRQGSTTIGSWNTGNLGTGYATYAFTLSGSEADAITDYGALALQVTGKMNAGGSGFSCITYVSWAEFACPDAAGGTVYYQSAAGSAAPAGGLVRRAGKGAAGSVTFAAVLLLVVGVQPVGLVAPSGGLARGVGKLASGSVTAVSGLVRRVGLGLASSMAPSGSLGAMRAFLVAVAGSLGPSGGLARRVGKGLMSSATPAGGLVRRVGLGLAGSLTVAGAVAGLVAGGVTAVAVCFRGMFRGMRRGM